MAAPPDGHAGAAGTKVNDVDDWSVHNKATTTTVEPEENGGGIMIFKKDQSPESDDTF